MFKIADIALTTPCAKPAPLRVMFRSCYFFLFSGQKNRGSMDRVHRGGPWTGSMGWSMDRVYRGGPWTRVHVLYTSSGKG